MSHLSNRPSKPAYYIVDCRIFYCFFKLPNHQSFLKNNVVQNLTDFFSYYCICYNSIVKNCHARQNFFCHNEKEKCLWSLQDNFFSQNNFCGFLGCPSNSRDVGLVLQLFCLLLQLSLAPCLSPNGLFFLMLSVH